MMNDHFFMRLAQEQAEKYGQDPSRKTGCVFVDEANNIVVTGYNQFPKGVKYSPERWERPRKYAFVEHAERSAIYFAARWGKRLNGCTVFIPWFPCADCARALVMVGVNRLVAYEPDWKEERYGFNDAAAILKEGGVKVDFLPGSVGEPK